MVIDKICKLTVKGVKLNSESFFSISHGVLELWRKTLGGNGFRPPAWMGLTLVYMGYFDNLFYMRGRPPVLLWHLASDSHKTWYVYTMR